MATTSRQPGCSDRTIRRRLAEWDEAGVGQELLRIGLVAYDRMIGLGLVDLAVVEFYLYLAAALTVIHCLINRARMLYRWPTQPITRRLS